MSEIGPYELSVEERTTFSARLLDNNSNEPNVTCMTYKEYRRQEALDDLDFAIARRRAIYRLLDMNRVPESGRSNVLTKLKVLQQHHAKERARIEEALALAPSKSRSRRE